MRNIAIIVLSVILAAAIISGLILYRDYIDTKDTLLISKKNLSDLNEKLTQLNQETSVLQDQVRKNAQALKELESANELISELEKAITMKDQVISELEKMIRIFQKNLEQEKDTKEALFTDLASRDTMVTELQKRVQGFQSNILYLEEQIAKEQNEIEGLRRALSDLEGQKVILEAKIGQLKSTYEALISERVKELESAKELISELEKAITIKDQIISEFGEMNRILQKSIEQEKKAKEAVETELASTDAMVTALQERLQGAQSNILSLKDEIAKDQNEIEGLEGKLLALKGEKATAEAKIGQLKSSYEAVISEHLEELKHAKGRISELENAINMKDQRLSESEKALRTVQEDLEEERKAKEASLAELHKGLQDAQSRSRFLKDEDAKKRNELGKLAGKLLALKGKKATAEAKIGQLKSTYEDLISDLKQQIENQEVTIKAFEEKISVTFVDRILFEFAKATITAEGRIILKRVGEILKKVQGRKIRVVGHSDNIPILPEYQYRFPSNWELSSARAAAVVRYFQKTTGFHPGNLEAVGRSFYEPVASNETPEGRAQNRRVEIIIAPKIE